MSGIWLIFMTYKSSATLGEIWTTTRVQKASIREQPNIILVNLRYSPYTDGTPLGGVAGEGCKDLRRHVRQSDKSITTLDDFEDFLFSSPDSGGMYSPNCFANFPRPQIIQLRYLRLFSHTAIFGQTILR
jgi:hypothetical protein